MDAAALKAALDDVRKIASYAKAMPDAIGHQVFVRPSTLVTLFEAAESQLKSLQEGK